MKKLLTLLFIGLAHLYAQTVPSYVPTNGLVGWWPFNGNANDESGNGNNGTVFGATLTADRNGNNAQAYSFNGSSDYVRVSNFSLNTVSSFSVSMWVKIKPVNNYQVFISKGPKTTGHFEIYSFLGTQKLSYHTANQCQEVQSTFSIADNRTHHIIIIQANGRVKFYVDQVLVNQQSCMGSISNITNDLTIGKIDNNVPCFTSGIIDDIGIWNRELTQQEINNLHIARKDSSPIPKNKVSFSNNDNKYTEPLKLSYHYVNEALIKGSYQYVNDALIKLKSNGNELDNLLLEYDTCSRIYNKYIAQLSPFPGFKITTENARLNTNQTLWNHEIYQFTDYKFKSLYKYGIDTSVVVDGLPIYISYYNGSYYHIRLNDFYDLYTNNFKNFREIMTTTRSQPIATRSDMLSEVLSGKFNKAVSSNRLRLTDVGSYKLNVLIKLTLIGSPVMYRSQMNAASKAKNRLEDLDRLYYNPIDEDYYYWGEKIDGCCFGSKDNKFIPVGLGYILSKNYSGHGRSDDFRHALVELPSGRKIEEQRKLQQRDILLGTVNPVKTLEAWVYSNSRALSMNYNLAFNWLDTPLDIMNVRIPSAFSWSNDQVYKKGNSFAIYSRGEARMPTNESTNVQAEGVFIGFNGSVFDGRLFYDPEDPSSVRNDNLTLARGLLYNDKPKIGTSFSGNFSLLGSISSYAFIPSDGFIQVTRPSANGTIVSDEYWENGAFVMSRADRESLLYAERIKREKEAAEQYEQERKRAESMAASQEIDRSKVSVSETNSKSVINGINGECNFVFKRPKLKFKYIDNRELCCCCRERYVPYKRYSDKDAVESSLYPKEELVQEVGYLCKQFVNHIKTNGYSEEHSESDWDNLLNFIRSTYKNDRLLIYVPAQLALINFSWQLTGRVDLSTTVEMNLYTNTGRYCRQLCERACNCAD